MSVDVNENKSKFSSLKYEQLLADKYFISTCFSKKFDSNKSKEILQDLYLIIKLKRT